MFFLVPSDYVSVSKSVPMLKTTVSFGSEMVIPN